MNCCVISFSRLSSCFFSIREDSIVNTHTLTDTQTFVWIRFENQNILYISSKQYWGNGIIVAVVLDGLDLSCDGR